MRLLIVILTLTTLVIVDHYKFGGRYGAEVSRVISKTIRSFT